ncbi:MAG: hypothetical protein HQ488_02910 [Parcubacteria group bacterium]|nr:hypothetical protein [Parcubacteria group bacterium]
MPLKQDTIQDILDSEQSLIQQSPEKYGEFFSFAMEAHALLQDFLLSVDATRFIFTLFLSQVRKHALLAILSTARLHRIQAHMDARQILESGASAAYAIANPDVSDFGEVDDNGIMETPQRLTNKRYRWLEEHHPDASRSIKGMKKTLNGSTLHANIVSGTLNFEPNLDEDVFGTPFFDTEDEYHIKNDLWMIGDITMGLMDLFYGVNQSVSLIKFSPEFLKQMKSLREQNNRLKKQMMESERFKAAMQLRTDSEDQ